MRPCKEWLNLLVKEKFINNRKREKLACAVVLGALYFGNDKEKVREWLG